VEEVKKQFWNEWMEQVFQGCVLAQHWRKRDVMPGEVVMLAEAEVEYPGYCLGKIESVKLGKDRQVRTMSIQYTNPGRDPQERSPMKMTTRPRHKIAVIVPVITASRMIKGFLPQDRRMYQRIPTHRLKLRGYNYCPEPSAGLTRWRRSMTSTDCRPFHRGSTSAHPRAGHHAEMGGHDLEKGTCPAKEAG
jgi:hypothetical protein